MTAREKFSIGDRVQLSKEGMDWLKHKLWTGEVVGFGRVTNLVAVVKDGFNTRGNYHMDFLEKEVYMAGTHLAHCYQGEYSTTCKYGDDLYCPAKTASFDDMPVERQELFFDHAIYLRKAEKHGEHAKYLLGLSITKDAISHARLAASHARRALAIEAQLA